MSYDTEKNRIKVARYRTRKGLREAGYDEDEIAAIVSQVDWASTTPVDVLNRYIEYDDSMSASTSPQTEEGTGGSSIWGWIVSGAIIGGTILLAILRANSGNEGSN